MIAILTKLAGWKGYAVTGAACLVVGFGSCWWLRDQMAAKAALAVSRAETKAAVRVIARVEKANTITADIGGKSAVRQTEIRWRTRTIIEKVPEYVTLETDTRFAVPYGFVRLHDAATLGSAPAVPDASAPPNDAASPVAFSAVTSTVTDNYGACRADQERLTSLQLWIATQAKAWTER